MYLFFDTETTGLPISWNAPISDSENWPRLVQIAWVIHNENGKETKSRNYIIKPENFFIPHEAAKVHKITTEIANEKGVALDAVLNEFANDVNNIKFLIAHNIDFDEKVIGAEFFRKNIKNKMSGIEKICTMKSSVDFCQIPGKEKYKYPKLQELYLKLFNKNFEDAHDAMVDVKACMKCFFEMEKLNIIKNTKQKTSNKNPQKAIGLTQSIFNF
ncbi:MAG: 3'-5' exonuclease [Patescibacteria group bacterium]|nr:3'-5' exonuclease [Patescibacteria group bacterium]MDD4304384.1 3'-5' exonuclease [Patescibacteria group bacterium]MDD4695407.1 3'-5' exonuclease [Patescibacteria group bacterium]